MAGIGSTELTSRSHNEDPCIEQNRRVQIPDRPFYLFVANTRARLPRENPERPAIFGARSMRDDLSTAKGLLIGLGLSIPIWAVIGMTFAFLTGCEPRKLLDDPTPQPGSCAYRPQPCTNAKFEYDEGRFIHCAIWDDGSSCLVQTRDSK